MNPSKISQTQSNKNKVWNAERVEECIRLIEKGKDLPNGSPFHEGDPNFKAENIVYEYSEWEMKEIAKCAADVVYFANNYCVAMTDYGVKKITLRPYQEKVLQDFQNHRFNVFLASRQIGKCFFRQTIIEILSKSSNLSQKIAFYEFYFSMLKLQRKLTIHEKIRYFLYKIESKLTHGKIYKLEI